MFTSAAESISSSGGHIDHLWIDGRPPVEGLRLAFPAPDRETVEEFHRGATGAGYRSRQAPSSRSDRAGSCFAASVLDPDGTAVESVFREPPVAGRS